MDAPEKKEKPEKKKRPIRPSYLDDFKKGTDGQYIYAGKHRVCELQGGAFRAWLTHCWVLLGAAAACLAGCGFLTHTGLDGRVYTIMPYAFAIAFAVLCIVKFFTPARSGGRLPVYRHERTVQRLAVYAAIPSILCAAALIGLVVDLLAGRSTGVMPNVAVTAALLAAAGVFFALFVARLRGPAWKEE